MQSAPIDAKIVQGSHAREGDAVAPFVHGKEIGSLVLQEFSGHEADRYGRIQ
jgi:hypothetical protein